MKNLSKFRIMAALLTLAWVTSCQKTDLETPAKPSRSDFDRAEYSKNIIDESVSGPYSVKNGVMHFRDLKSFDETVAKFKTLSDTEKALFVNDGGFSSYSNEFTKILVKLNNAQDKSEYEKIVSQNKDILEVNQDGMLRPRIGDRSMNDFVNREGIIYIGKVLYMFGKTEQRIAFDGEVTTLKNAEESKQLMILKLPTNVKNARNCFGFYAQREQNGNRRATASTGVATESYFNGYSGGGPTYIVQFKLRVLGYPEKKNFWGNYNNYDTDNDLTAAFTFGVFPLNSGGQSKSMAVTDDVSNHNQYSITIDRALVFGDLQTISDPNAFLNEHVYYLDDATLGPPSNTYSTRGVSIFQYGCP